MTRRTRQSSPLHWLRLSLLCLLGSATLVHAVEQGLYDDKQEDEYYCPEDYPIDVQPESPSDIEQETRKAAEEMVGQSAFSFLDPQYEYVSDYLRRFTTSVDQFFANTEKPDAVTGSYIQLTFDTLWNEGGDINFDPNIRFRAHLPQTQKKLKLIIESDPEEKRNTQERETGAPEPTTESQQSSGVYTGVEGKIGGGETWKINPSFGVRVRAPLDFYARLRATREHYFDKWKLYFNETLYWFDSTGYGADTTMEWDRLLSEDVLFRSSSFIRYTEERKLFDMSQSFNLIHQITENRKIIYKIAAFADSKPSLYATAYLINLNYRQNVHKNFVFVEVQPQIYFQKINKFDSEFSLLLRLELFYRG